MKVEVIYECYFNQGMGDVTGYREKVTRHLDVESKEDASKVALVNARTLCSSLAQEKGYYSKIDGVKLVFGPEEVVICELDIDALPQ